MLITLPLFQYPLYSASLAEYNMEQVRTSKTINKWSKHRQTMPLSRWVTTLLRREVGHWTLLSLRGLIKLQRWGDTTTLARVLQHCNLFVIMSTEPPGTKSWATGAGRSGISLHFLFMTITATFCALEQSTGTQISGTGTLANGLYLYETAIPRSTTNVCLNQRFVIFSVIHRA